ncbi:MAG TPA: glycosyltransferase family 4 protein, partial [Gemmatimonadaceae bacterium]|nr:glycosyltransferase family 4 protein [Gemmatimonadaceae bacterium]
LCDAGNAESFSRRWKANDFVLWVGRNDPVKNPADFVRLAARCPDLNFVMIGERIDSLSLRDEWGVDTPDNLGFTGVLTRSEVQDAIAASSALVVTSRREGFPTLVLEAHARGKPVLVPNDPGCTEALGNTEGGCIYEHGDIEELRASLIAVLAEDDSARALRRRHRILTMYDWRVIAPRLDALYRGDAA